MHLGVVFEVLMCGHAVATTHVVCTNGLELNLENLSLGVDPPPFFLGKIKILW